MVDDQQHATDVHVLGRASQHRRTVQPGRRVQILGRYQVEHAVGKALVEVVLLKVDLREQIPFRGRLPSALQRGGRDVDGHHAPTAFGQP
ncbi:hypothetical protein A5681_00090 [Mycobacterium scrofulaceum]|nr:hypothetical protein A5681_00090 [Mycobacterium scrofulaceum]